MLNTKRETFRVQIRKCRLESAFQDHRKLVFANPTREQLDSIIIKLQNEFITEQALIDAIFELEKYDFHQEWVKRVFAEVQLDSLLMQLLKKAKPVKLRVGLIITITNYLMTEDLAAQYYFTDNHLFDHIFKDQGDAQYWESIITCIANLPRSFLMMNQIQTRLNVISTLRPYKDCDIENYYAALQKLVDSHSEQLEVEIFQYCIRENLFREMVKDLKTGCQGVLDVLINLTTIEENELIEQVVDYEFVCAVLDAMKFETEQVWVLIDNLTQSSKEIRQAEYDFKIYHKISEELTRANQSLKQNTLFEIIKVTQTFLQMEEISQQIVRQQIRDANLEGALLSTFKNSLLADSLLALAAQTLCLYYELGFPQNVDESQTQLIEKQAHKSSIIEALLHNLTI